MVVVMAKTSKAHRTFSVVYYLFMYYGNAGSDRWSWGREGCVMICDMMITYLKVFLSYIHSYLVEHFNVFILDEFVSVNTITFVHPQTYKIYRSLEAVWCRKQDALYNRQSKSLSITYTWNIIYSGLKRCLHGPSSSHCTTKYKTRLTWNMLERSRRLKM